MHVSYGEMARSAPEVLRMLGCPYGQADDAVEALLYTQAALGRGYTLIKMTDAARTADWKPVTLTQQADGTYVVDMRGAPLLLYAARLSDLVVARSVPEAETRVHVRNTFGGWVVPYLGHRLARSGLSSTVRWSPPPRPSNLEAPESLAVTMCPDEGKPIEVMVSPGEAFQATPAEPASVPVGAFSAECTSGSDFGTLSIVANEGRTRSSPKAGPLIGTAGVLRLDELMNTFVANGAEVDAAEHAAHYVGIAARLRVLSSERSRAQAG